MVVNFVILIVFTVYLSDKYTGHVAPIPRVHCIPIASSATVGRLILAGRLLHEARSSLGTCGSSAAVDASCFMTGCGLRHVECCGSVTNGKGGVGFLEN